jgi:hypothetical protein
MGNGFRFGTTRDEFQTYPCADNEDYLELVENYESHATKKLLLLVGLSFSTMSSRLDYSRL